LRAAQQQYDAERVVWEQTKATLTLQVDKVRLNPVASSTGLTRWHAA
jgi:hypothetical protein